MLFVSLCLWQAHMLSRKLIRIRITRRTPKKNLSWRPHTDRLQDLLSGYNNKDSMILAREYTHRPEEQNREPRSRSTQTFTILPKKKSEDNSMGKESL